MGDGTASALAAAVWDGAIPVCLSLDEREVATPQTPPSLFALVPRGTYLPTLSDAAFAHFRDVLPPGDNELWFDAGGVPLKWQLPCGVLHDLLAGSELPWRLTVHFRAFPEGALTHCSGPDAVRGHLFNSLKAWRGATSPRLGLGLTLCCDRLQEACYLANGSASAVLTLHSAAQTDVWQARSWPRVAPSLLVLMQHRRACWTTTSRAISAALLLCTPARARVGARARCSLRRCSHADLCACCRRVSIRLHVRCAPAAGTQHGLRDVVSSSHALPTDDTSTLRVLLAGLLPEEWQKSSVRIQGIEAPLDAPLRLLNSYLCGPDGFMHVCALLGEACV